MKDITFDHEIPTSKGGMDVLENYKLAHYECNQLKGNMLPEEFAEFQKGNVIYNETQDDQQENTQPAEENIGAPSGA